MSPGPKSFPVSGVRRRFLRLRRAEDAAAGGGKAGAAEEAPLSRKSVEEIEAAAHRARGDLWENDLVEVGWREPV